MTISSQNRKAGPFVGNDSSTVFPFAFKVFAASDLYVVKTDTTLGSDTVLVLNTDYTTSLNADQDANPGGSVTLPTALATGFKLTITSSLQYLQPTDLTNQGGFYPKVITNSLDRLTIFVQQIFEQVQRSLKVSVSTPAGVQTTLPPPAANKIIAWNEAADNLQNMDPVALATVVAFSTANADQFSGDGVTTQFALSANPAALNNLDVSVGGVTQRPGVDYTWSAGTTITFTSAPPVGTNNVLVRYMQGLPSGITQASAVTYQPASGAGTDVQTALRNAESVISFGGAIRNTSGTWSMIADSGHAPIGIASVSQPDAYTYKINYTTPGSKVGTVLSIADYELAPYGPHTGASGATNSATFCMYAPCVLYVNGRGSVSASPLWTTQTGPITTPDATSVQISHANRALAVDPPIVTPIVPAAGSLTRQYHVAWGATTTTITSLDDIQGYAYYDGAAWQLASCPNLGVGISYSAGGLTVTHPDATGHYQVQVSGLNTNLRPEVASIGNTTFTIQWRDTAGAVVGPAATTGMKVLFLRKALVPSTMDTGVRFAVDLGLCRVANADVGNVSLNNFWVVGLNNR